MPMHIKPEAIPIEPSTSFSPTHAAYIHRIKQKILIFNLTPSLPSLFSPESLNLSIATDLATATPSPPVVFTINKENLFGTHFSVKDGDGKDVAKWETLVLSLHMGRSTLEFLAPRAEMVVMEPTGFGRRAEAFIKDNVTYIWEGSHYDQKTLYKVFETSSGAEETTEPIIKKTKKEVAKYAQKSGRSTGGLLVFDSREIEEALVILTLCAMLKTTDSFSGTGL